MPTGIAIFFDEETRKKNDDARFMTERFFGKGLLLADECSLDGNVSSSVPFIWKATPSLG